MPYPLKSLLDSLRKVGRQNNLWNTRFSLWVYPIQTDGTGALAPSPLLVFAV